MCDAHPSLTLNLSAKLRGLVIYGINQADDIILLCQQHTPLPFLPNLNKLDNLSQ